MSFHFLELALAGPQTAVWGVILIIGVPVGAIVLQPRVTRATRFALCVAFGLMFAATGAVAHVLDLFTSGPRWDDVTGTAFAVGGMLLVGAGCAALAAEPRSPRRASAAGRVAHVVAWVIGALLIGQFVIVGMLGTVITTHAVRLPVDQGALDVDHDSVQFEAPTGAIAAWYVPPRNGAAVLLVHGSGGDRASVVDEAELLARHGYGVLSIDLPGHGESDGHANLLGANTQPAISAALDWLDGRPEVDRGRIAGLGSSLGAEVLLEAAAADPRLAAVIADGAERASDDRELGVDSGLAALTADAQRALLRVISGTTEPPPLIDLVDDIAPRPILLIAAGERPHEIEVNRAYQRAAGAGAELWEVPDAAHTEAVETDPLEYERRVISFLNQALGPSDSGGDQP